MAAEQLPVANSGEKLLKAILRDIYGSEELKIQSNRCKLLKETIDALCAGPNDIAFSKTFDKLRKDIVDEKKKKKEQGMSKGCRVLYLYQVERLPHILSRLGVEKAGSSNDCILWQVPELDVA